MNRGRLNRVLDVGVIPLILPGVLAFLLFVNSAAMNTDDAFIYLTAAEHWSEGLGPVLNPGDQHYPVTSLLWAGFLALMNRLSFLSTPLVAKYISGFLLATSGLLLAEVLGKPRTFFRWLVPLLLVSAPLFRTTVGLEIHLALFCVSAAIFFSTRRGNIVGSAAWVALGFFCRGEVILLALPLALVFGWQAWRDDATVRGNTIRKKKFQSLGLAALLGTSLLVTGFGLQKSVTDEFFPSTLKVKQIQGSTNLDRHTLPQMPDQFFKALGGQWLLLPVVLLGLAVSLRQIGLFLSFTLLHLVAYATLGVRFYPWYAWSLTVTVLLCFGAGVAFLGQRGWSHWRRTEVVSQRAMACLLLVVGGWATVLILHQGFRFRFTSRADWAGVGEAPFVTAYLEVCQWVEKDWKSPHGIKNRSPILLASEVGILSHQCEGEIRDVFGIASPGLTKKNLKKWYYWTMKYEPDYIISRRRLKGEEDNKTYRRGDKVLSYDLQQVFEAKTYEVAIFKKIEPHKAQAGENENP